MVCCVRDFVVLKSCSFLEGGDSPGNIGSRLGNHGNQSFWINKGWAPFCLQGIMMAASLKARRPLSAVKIGLGIFIMI